MQQKPVTPQPAGLLRRLAAMSYDCLVVMALLIISTMIITPFIHFQIIEPGVARWRGATGAPSKEIAIQRGL